MSDGWFGVIFAIGAMIFIVAVSYIGSTLPVPDNLVAGQAMVVDEPER